jgi:hypothetical protein
MNEEDLVVEASVDSSDSPSPDMAFMLLFLLGLLAFLFLLAKNKRSDGLYTLPGPSPWLSLPLIGHSYLLGKNPIPTMNKMYEKVSRLSSSLYTLH